MSQAAHGQGFVATRRALARASAVGRAFDPLAVLASIAFHVAALVALTVAIVGVAREPDAPGRQAVVDLVIGTNAAANGASAPAPSPVSPTPPAPATGGAASAPAAASAAPPVPRTDDGIAPPPASAANDVEAPLSKQGTRAPPAVPPPQTAPPEVRIGGGIAATYAEIENAGVIRPAQSETGNMAPDYPLEAALKNEQGIVTLQIFIAADGTVSRVEIEKSSGFAILDAAARDRVATWRFHPATKDGVPVASMEEQSIRFLP